LCPGRGGKSEKKKAPTFRGKMLSAKTEEPREIHH